MSVHVEVNFSYTRPKNAIVMRVSESQLQFERGCLASRYQQ